MIRKFGSGAAALVLTAAMGLTAAHAASTVKSGAGENRASQIIGKTVTNSMDQKIGTVDDLVISRDGHSVRAVLSVGGFLGIGDKLVSVPFTDIKRKADALVLDRTADQLKRQPAYKYQLAATTASTHDSYMRSTERRMNSWDKRMTDWKKSAKNASSGAGAKLDQAWAATKARWADLKSASADGWDSAKASFDKAWADLQSAWKDATS
jgi:sporulation protein YlmC with PRC-barrel domain